VSPALFARRALVVSILSLTFTTFLWTTSPEMELPRSVPNTTGNPPRSDVQLFIRIVEDVRHGQGYYVAAREEMRAGGYPTRSVFNWRQPMIYVALSHTPRLLIQFWLIVLAGKLLWDASKALPSETFTLVPMLNACVGLLVPGATYLTEAWAGACIALSLLSYTRKRDRAGAVWGLMAVFIRELAAPYCLFAGCVAVCRRRWAEVRVWALGAACYAAYFGLHAMQVLRHIAPDDRAQLNSWVAFGGLPFLAETLKTNGLLLLAPRYAVAIVAVALVAAWWDRRLPLHARVTLVLYAVLFLVVGLPFNGYWGLLMAPTVSLWLAYSWGGLRTVWDPYSRANDGTSGVL